jgi:hypothetical protein
VTPKDAYKVWDFIQTLKELRLVSSKATEASYLKWCRLSCEAYLDAISNIDAISETISFHGKDCRSDVGGCRQTNQDG